MKITNSPIIEIFKSKDRFPTFKSSKFLTFFIINYGNSHQLAAMIWNEVLLIKAILAKNKDNGSTVVLISPKYYSQ